MTTTTKIIVALLVLLALALGVFGYYTANRVLTARQAVQQPARTAARTASAPVVVAVKPLPPGAPIASDAVKVMPYPMVPEGALTSVSQAIGQIPQASIGSGAPVLKSALLSGLSLHVQNGFRAVAIHVDKVIAVGDHLHPGDYVDVFFSLPAAQSQAFGAVARVPAVAEAAQARMLLSDLRVLAVGPQTVARTLPVESAPTQAFGPAAQQTRPYEAPPSPPTSVVLQVPTAEVAKLLMAEENGKLQLALRNPKDIAQPDTEAFPSPSPAIVPTLLPVAQRKPALQIPENKAYAGLTLPGLRGQEKAPAPLPVSHGVRPPSKPTVEIYRGDQKQTVAY